MQRMWKVAVQKRRTPQRDYISTPLGLGQPCGAGGMADALTRITPITGIALADGIPGAEGCSRARRPSAIFKSLEGQVSMRER